MTRSKPYVVRADFDGTMHSNNYMTRVVAERAFQDWKEQGAYSVSLCFIPRDSDIYKVLRTWEDGKDP